MAEVSGAARDAWIEVTLVDHDALTTAHPGTAWTTRPVPSGPAAALIRALELPFMPADFALRDDSIGGSSKSAIGQPPPHHKH